MRRGAAAAGVAAPPAKVVAERLGVPVLQPERPDAGLDLDAPTVVVCAYGLLIPEALLGGEAVAQRPSVAPAALARRGAGRARDPGRRRRDRGHDPRDREGARRRPDRRAGARSRSGPTTTRARSSSAPPSVAARLLDGVLAEPAPSFTPQSRRRRHLRGQDRAGRPRARPRAPRRRARAPGAGAVAAHRRPRRAARPPGHGLAGAGGGDGRVRAARGAAGRRQADGRRAWLRGLR